MNKIELLAPAGSLESLYASINNGADAVYLGGSKFSARAYASNFNNEELEKAVDYAHLYGVKVYITLNTLIKESELSEAKKYIGFLYRIGVDALIVQDLGVFNFIKENYNDFEVHASTQMTIHNGEGAMYFRDKGFLRIVLSRELSIDEIKHISKDLGIETEIFIHGALCVCYSGQCLMSSMIGGRSGNRGRCAQSCRLPYSLISKKDNSKHTGYLLSPKDICTIENVEDIVDTNTKSLKIEGRMKRPEYVAGVVSNYKEAVNSLKGKRKYNPLEGKRVLAQLFNREGFSKAFLYKNEGKTMMAYKTPKNTGIFLGTVQKNDEIELHEDINLKDGVRCGETGFIVSKILKGKTEVTSAKRGESVKLFPVGYKKGDELYKTLDVNLSEKFKESYTNKFMKKISLSVKVEFIKDNNFIITSEYKGKLFTATGDIVSEAINKPLDKKRIEESLKKSGDTPFKIENVTFTTFEDGFLKVSSLNEVRRKLISEIESTETKKYKRHNGLKIELLNAKKEQSVDLKELKYIFEVSTKEQLKAMIDKKINLFCVNPFGKNENDIKVTDLKNLEKYILKVPEIVKGEFDIICNIIDSNKENISAILTQNAGIIRKYKDDFQIIGDYKLNIFNSLAAKFYEEDLSVIPISVELNRKEIKEMLKNYSGNTMIFAYGRVKMMVSEYCPVGSTFGGKNKKKSCNNACIKNEYVLKDRMNEEFNVKTDIFCRSSIYNSKRTNITNDIDDMEKMGISKFKFEFTDESYDEVMKILSNLKTNGEIFGDNFTKGHYKRGVQ